MVCSVSGATLKIQVCRESLKFPSFGVDSVAKDLVITVPADWICHELDIDAAAASVEVRDLKIISADIDAASGICWFSNCVVNGLDVDTASGDITFTGILEALDCDATSANCTIEVWNVPKSIDIDAASGDLDLILPENAGFTCSMDTLSGTFQTDFACTDHDDTHTHGDGACKISVSAMSGNVTIYKSTTHHQETHHN